MLDFAKLIPQFEALADKIALDQAAQGLLPDSWWTEDTVRRHNRRWLAARAPELLAQVPKAVEPAVCAAEGCGGWCILAGWDKAAGRVAQTCQKCGRLWAVALAAYASL